MESRGRIKEKDTIGQELCTMSFFQSANSHFHGRWMRSIQTDGMDFGFLVSASRKTDHVYGSYVRVGTIIYCTYYTVHRT